MNSETQTDWLIEVFYDGECPLCVREIKMLRWLDRRDRIRFADIATDAFDPAEHGKTMQEFMDEIQGRLPSGDWIIGVEVFRHLYSAVGFGWLVWPTRWPGISHAMDFGYRVFAKNRLRLTGRCSTTTCEPYQSAEPSDRSKVGDPRPSAARTK